MRDEDLEKFASVLNGLAAVKTGAKLSREALHVWWNAFQNWSIEEFTAAAAHLLTAQKWMPDPSEFHGLRRAGDLSAHEAWEMVLSGTPLPRGSLVERVARMVGRSQTAIRRADMERDLPHIQRRFLEAYETHAFSDPVRERLPEVASQEYRAALRAPEPVARVAARLTCPREPQLAHETAVVEQQTPAAPVRPRVVVTPRDKVVRLIALGMSDDEIARVSREPLEFVREVRAEQSAQGAAA